MSMSSLNNHDDEEEKVAEEETEEEISFGGQSRDYSPLSAEIARSTSRLLVETSSTSASESVTGLTADTASSHSSSSNSAATTTTTASNSRFHPSYYQNRAELLTPSELHARQLAAKLVDSTTSSASSSHRGDRKWTKVRRHAQDVLSLSQGQRETPGQVVALEPPSDVDFKEAGEYTIPEIRQRHRWWRPNRFRTETAVTTTPTPSSNAYDWEVEELSSALQEIHRQIQENPASYHVPFQAQYGDLLKTLDKIKTRRRESPTYSLEDVPSDLEYKELYQTLDEIRNQRETRRSLESIPSDLEYKELAQSFEQVLARRRQRYQPGARRAPPPRPNHGSDGSDSHIPVVHAEPVSSYPASLAQSFAGLITRQRLVVALLVSILISVIVSSVVIPRTGNRGDSPADRGITFSPTWSPTGLITTRKTLLPSIAPTTTVPTILPSFEPSVVPSSAPTELPTGLHSFAPTTVPTSSTEPCAENNIFCQPSSSRPSPLIVPELTASPIGTTAPTESPFPTTRRPTSSPSASPSNLPTSGSPRPPLLGSTNLPSRAPTSSPSFASNTEASNIPTFSATTRLPTLRPTNEPSSLPRKSPSWRPTMDPTFLPSQQPTKRPTLGPTQLPTPGTQLPTLEPTDEPSPLPTKFPSEGPTWRPTGDQTFSPSRQPTRRPTFRPTQPPTPRPSPTPTLPLLPRQINGEEACNADDPSRVLYQGTGRSGDCECDRFTVPDEDVITCYMHDSLYCENEVCSRQFESFFFLKATDRLDTTQWCVWCDRREDCALDGLIPTCFRGRYDADGIMTSCNMYEAVDDGRSCDTCTPCQRNGEWGMIFDCPDSGYSSNAECVTASEIVYTGRRRTQQCVKIIYAECDIFDNACCIDFDCSFGRCVPPP